MLHSLLLDTPAGCYVTVAQNKTPLSLPRVIRTTAKHIKHGLASARCIARRSANALRISNHFDLRTHAHNNAQQAWAGSFT